MAKQRACHRRGAAPGRARRIGGTVDAVGDGARGGAVDRPRRRPEMLDIVFLATTVAFFAVSLAYVRGCDRL